MQKRHRHGAVQAWSHAIGDSATTVGYVLFATHSLYEFGKKTLYVDRAVLRTLFYLDRVRM